MKNYLQFKQFSLLFDHYAFVDVPQYYADQLFIQHQVRVHFGRECVHPDHPYVIVFCKVRKRDRDKFLAALADLFPKMILCGYPKYESFCQSFIEAMDGDAKSAEK